MLEVPPSTMTPVRTYFVRDRLTLSAECHVLARIFIPSSAEVVIAFCRQKTAKKRVLNVSLSRTQ